MTGASPRSYDSSGVGSWSQDSRRTSPFLASTSIKPLGIATPKQDIEEESPGMWRTSRIPDDDPDTDHETILLQRSSPKHEMSESTDKEDEVMDEPQDFSMKTLLAKEAEEREQEELRKQRIIEEEVARASKIPFVLPGQYGIPFQSNSNTLAPPQIPFPYFMPTPLFHHPYAASLPNELFLRLANAIKPLPSSEVLGSSAPGHIDSKLYRFSRRPAPYKVGSLLNFSEDVFAYSLECSVI